MFLIVWSSAPLSLNFRSGWEPGVTFSSWLKEGTVESEPLCPIHHLGQCGFLEETDKELASTTVRIILLSSRS